MICNLIIITTIIIIIIIIFFTVNLDTCLFSTQQVQKHLRNHVHQMDEDQGIKAQHRSESTVDPISINFPHLSQLATCHTLATTHQTDKGQYANCLQIRAVFTQSEFIFCILNLNDLLPVFRHQAKCCKMQPKLPCIPSTHMVNWPTAVNFRNPSKLHPERSQKLS